MPNTLSNSSIPYSVYDGTSGGSGGAFQNLEETLTKGDDAGGLSITNLNTLNVGVINSTAITNSAGISATNISASGYVWAQDISASNLIETKDLSATDILCEDLSSNGVIFYNGLLPPIQETHPPITWILQGELTGAYSVATDYKIAGLTNVQDFVSNPPAPYPQGSLSSGNGYYANGYQGWYMCNLHIQFKKAPTFYFNSLNTTIFKYSNAGATPPADISYSFYDGYASNSITQTTKDYNFMIFLEQGCSVEFGFNCATQTGGTYEIGGKVQFSGQLMSVGVNP